MPEISRKIQKFDAEGLTVGRLATRIATVLRGKHKVSYQPHIDNGDIVEVVNADKLKFSGKKLGQRVYYSFSGYPGGLKTKKMSEINKNNPGDIIFRAVREMLPNNRLRNGMLKRLNIK